MRESAEWLGAAWSGIYLAISNSLPVSFFGDIDPKAVLTTNEQREILGYNPIEETQQNITNGTDTSI